MGKSALSWFQTIAMVVLGIYLLCSQALLDSQNRELKYTGKSVVGTLTMATQHSVNSIPIGYSFTINYAEQSKEFDISERLFYTYVNDEGKFKINQKITVIFLPDRPEVAELPEMLDLLFWWLGGPLLKYPFGATVLLFSLLEINNKLVIRGPSE